MIIGDSTDQENVKMIKFFFFFFKGVGELL